MNSVKSIWITIITLISFVFTAYGQRQENIWAFGSHAGIDFNQNPPQPVYNSILSTESSASICDASGQLLFYTDGFYVWDRNHNRMPNGDSLAPFTYNGESSTQSTAQGAVIVPYPGSINKFIIFSLTQMEINTDKGKLYYSVVDMDLNQGKGDVMLPQRARFLGSGFLEKMIAVAGNQCNFWLLAGAQNGKLKAYSITETGVNTTPVISGANLGSSSLMIGTMCVSPDRSKIAATILGSQSNSYHGLTVYNFDVSSGTVSNAVNLLTNQGAYGSCFSPDSRKIYITSAGKILQFDLSVYTAPAVAASQKVIGTTAAITGLKLGPDKKIYFFSKYNGQASVLGAVQYPDNEASLSGYTAEAITLKSGTAMVIGLPNAVPVLPNSLVTTTTNVIFPCFKNSVNLVPRQQAAAYVWQDGVGDSIRSVDSGGLYIVRYQKKCQYYIDSFIVQDPGEQLPGITVSGTCRGTTRGKAWIIRSPGGTQSSIRWYHDGVLLSTADTLSGIGPDSFTVGIHLPSGCDTQLNVLIPEIHDPAGILADSLACTGDTVHFESASTPGPAPVWWVGNNIRSATGTLDYIFEQAGKYTVLLIGSGGVCSDTAIAYIHVDAPDHTIRLEKDAYETCTGTAITLSLTGDTAGHVRSFNWELGDGVTIEGHEPFLSHTYDLAGTRTITVTANFRACPAITLSGSVKVSAMPLIDLGPDTAMCPGAQPVILSNLAVNAMETENMWQTGDTGRTQEATQPGLYSLTVTTPGSNCSARDTVKITIGCRFDIPNAFTPNGDGLNDYFSPKSLLSANLSGFHMQIFNRWGQKIFETTTTDSPGWNGHFNNVLQPVGVYIYMIEASFEQGKSELYKGNVTLIR